MKDQHTIIKRIKTQPQINHYIGWILAFTSSSCSHSRHQPVQPLPTLHCPSSPCRRRPSVEPRPPPVATKQRATEREITAVYRTNSLNFSVFWPFQALSLQMKAISNPQTSQAQLVLARKKRTGAFQKLVPSKAHSK